jgi:hypothetical protein
MDWPPFFNMNLLRPLKSLRRFVQIACFVCAAVCNSPSANAGFSFIPGHIYSTWAFGNTSNVFEYSADGTFLDSLTVPSLLQNDELRGIAFGPDGLLYAVMVHFADSGYQVLALDSAGAVHQTYRMDGIYVWGGGSYGKIAIDDQGNMYVAGATALVHFTIGDPNSGTILYPHDQMEDIKILHNGNFFVASDYAVDEITSTGSFVRNVVSSNGIDFVNIWGIEYNSVTDKLFVTQLGTTGSIYSILRVNASTGEIETGALLNYASDLFLTASGNLAVGSWTEPAQIYDQDMMLVGPLGTDQRFFVTQYPTGQPTPTPTPSATPTATPTATTTPTATPTSTPSPTPCRRCSPRPRPRPTPAPRP